MPLAAAGRSGSGQQPGDYAARWLDTQQKLAALAAPPTGAHGAAITADSTYVTSDLRQQADDEPDKLVQVIIQGAPGVDVVKALRDIVGPGVDVKSLDLVNGAAVEVKAGRLKDLLGLRGLTITPDALVRLTDDGTGATTTTAGATTPTTPTTPDLSALPADLTTGAYTSTQMWPHETGNSFAWGTPKNPAPQA